MYVSDAAKYHHTSRVSINARPAASAGTFIAPDDAVMTLMLRLPTRPGIATAIRRIALASRFAEPATPHQNGTAPARP
ncbi:MAG: hypothetical protein BroJett003_07180 [Planctomycetota bacterium]|nr:MAG: hypothetical protein BroJett003_07180 [Planctomycetota bacterium]